ncbi:hypothetical protein BGZ99_006719 [Dissophora globulifera]|uniref:Uncharacterized protein n=1 Tax=Dissophora globulifera TaxID=979702 RepID=A0A9P6RE91_9FUNG|nr:hypothetical protein BGZ99_006719 [Dissophora globulifera]
MPIPNHLAVPTFIHLEDEKRPSSKRPREQQQHRNSNRIDNNNISNVARSSPNVEQTALALKRITISRNNHLHPLTSSPSSSTSYRSSRYHNKRRGRPATSRVRGKHGHVKAASAHLLHSDHRYRTTTTGTTGDTGSTADMSSGIGSRIRGPFDRETRSEHLQHYMQSRRLRLRQRLMLQRQQHHQQEPLGGGALEASDMSLDEADVHDGDDDDDDDDDHHPNDYSDHVLYLDYSNNSDADRHPHSYSTGTLGDDHLFIMDPVYYRRYMWELEQRLWERTESAARSRTHFLTARRISASDRVDHVQRVVQRQRTAQELRQLRVRDELEQKMVRAMARRNAYLEAAIENDPSRRFRQRSATSHNNNNSSNISSRSISATSASAIAAPATPTATGEPVVVKAKMNSSAAAAMRASLSSPTSSTFSSTSSAKTDFRTKAGSAPATATVAAEDEAVTEAATAKNSSVVNMAHTTAKRHLTNMTSTTTRMSPSPSSPFSTTEVHQRAAQAKASGEYDDAMSNISRMDVDLNNTNNNNNRSKPIELDLTVQQQQQQQRRSRQQRLAQKASREYMQALGGSHERVLAMGFSELSRLLHMNKGLIQAAVKLLRCSAQLVEEMDQQQHDDQPQAERGTAPAATTPGSREAFKNPARVFLSMYMVLAHPNQIRSPVEPTAPSNSAGHNRHLTNGDDSAFESLVESSKALLEALQTWLAANHRANQESSETASPASDAVALESAAITSPSSSTTYHPQLDNATLVRNFDQAWTSYYHFFQAWKDKDAKRLLQTLLDHARQIEALWRSVQTDPSARTEWEPRIEEQRRDLRAKAGQLAGPDGVAQLDAVFADFVSFTGATTITDSVAATAAVSTDATAPSVKKRQRVSSVSATATATADDTTTAASSSSSTKPTSGTASPKATSAEAGASSTSDSAAANQGPKPKKSAQATEASAVSLEEIVGNLPAGFEKPSKWTNLQLIHELALDAGFKIESRRPSGGATTPSSGQDSDDRESSSSSDAGSQTLEARIRAMATKAYFDRIREDAEQGQLRKWIPSILTSIREQLLDMLPPTSAMAMQVEEAFDLEFVQQQVDQGVYDMKAALNSVVLIMSRLCAPVRDTRIKKLKEDLGLVQQNPFLKRAASPGATETEAKADENSATTTTADSTTSSTTATSSTYTATSVTPKDLVSVLQEILEVLEVMMLDMANFRLTVARPRLEKQAIPYEQNAFKDLLEEEQVSLEPTRIWLQESASRLAPTSSSALSSSSAVASDPHNTSHFRSNNKYYEILVQGLLDLIFSKKHFNVSPDREQLSATLALDVERLMRYQNEVQGLALVAVMLNVAQNVPPMLKEEDQGELKNTLLKLIESPDTSRDVLVEAIVEAKERALLLASRALSSRSSSPSPTPASASLLLTAEQKSYVSNTLAKAISFDSTLYSVLSKRVRKVLEFYLLTTVEPVTSATAAAAAVTAAAAAAAASSSSSPSTMPATGPAPASIATGSSGDKRAGAMPEQVELNKMGLGALTTEMEQLARQIRFLTKYNAQVYRQWYDPMLGKILSQQHQQQQQQEPQEQQ